MKVNKADIWFSRCIRKASNWTCVRCGSVYDQSSTGLHCSHVFSRRHRTIRWCKDNAMSLCYSCHSWYGGNPVDSGNWAESVLGSGVVEMLREKMNSRTKISKKEEQEISKHYRDQFKKMEETGILYFESYQ